MCLYSLSVNEWWRQDKNINLVREFVILRAIKNNTVIAQVQWPQLHGWVEQYQIECQSNGTFYIAQIITANSCAREVVQARVPALPYLPKISYQCARFLFEEPAKAIRPPAKYTGTVCKSLGPSPNCSRQLACVPMRNFRFRTFVLRGKNRLCIHHDLVHQIVARKNREPK